MLGRFSPARLRGRFGKRRQHVDSHEKQLLATTLASIGDAVIVADPQGRITFLNAEAERLTGWKSAEAAGQPLPNVFRIINEETRQPSENPVEKVLRLGTVVGLANHTILIAKDGTETPIDDSASPIREHSGGRLLGVVLVFRDVTEQKKAQQARSRLAAIVEFSGEAILTKNLDGIIQTWNSGAEELFGYRPEEIIGKPITTLIPPNRLEEEAQILERLRRGKPVERLETIRMAKSGRCIPVSLSISPIKDGAGRVIGASKIVHDISEMVAARDELAREKELLATTLTSIGDGVIVTDAQGQVTFVNKETERLTGWTNREAAGQPLPTVFRILNEHTRHLVENPVEKVLRHGNVVGLANHTVLLHKEGIEFPIDDSAAPIRRAGGPVLGVVLVFRDVTERKRAEAESAHLAAIVASSTDAILSKTLTGIITTWNDSAQRMFGYTPEEIIGQPILRLIPPDRQPEEEQILARLRAGERVEHFETVRVTKEGRLLDVSLTISPIKDPAGVIIGASKIVRDITERKLVEAALAKAQAELIERATTLEQIVADRTAKLRETVQELEAFSYSIAHDMRAPLRAMQGYSHMLREEFSEHMTADGLEYLRRIGASAGRLDHLIQDVLNYSKIIRADVALEEMDGENFIRDIVESYPNLQPPVADIQVEGPIPHVMANPAAFTQVVSNLLGNAVKFVKPGVKPRVRVWAQRVPDKMVRIWFEDNGIGIDKEVQERIFFMFQRINPPGQYEGTGIGLTIVRKAAERMGGKVGLESEPGQGSKFWIELNASG